MEFIGRDYRGLELYSGYRDFVDWESWGGEKLASLRPAEACGIVESVGNGLRAVREGTF